MRACYTPAVFDATPLVQLIGNLGFPIAVAVFLLVRLDKWGNHLAEITAKLDRIIDLLDRRP